MHVHSWGNLWTTRYKKTKKPKKQKTQLPLSKSQEQKQGVEGTTRGLNIQPALNTSKRVGKTPKPPLHQPLDVRLLSPQVKSQLTCLPQGAGRGEADLSLVFSPCCVAGASIKPHLSFLVSFSLSFFIFIKRPFSSSSLSAIMVVSSAYLRLLIFLPAILIPACALSSPAFLMM